MPALMPPPVATSASTPPPGRLVDFLPQDRLQPELTRQLSPGDVDQILRAANTGDCQRQAKLAREMVEKDWDLAQALQTRVAAVAGTPWELQPGADTLVGRRIAAFVERALRAAGSVPGDEDLDGFGQLLNHMLTSYLPGYSVNEIVWDEGGRGVLGFQFIEPQFFTLRDSTALRLVTPEQPLGVELPRGKFIVHRYCHRGGDLTRGGLIRPLAWLYVFKNLNVKDLLRFLEKYGMPFLLARLDQAAYDEERHHLAYLIRHFGSDGGGVFTKAAELQVVQPGANQGDVYFKFMDYCERAISKLILGQTSTSDSKDSNRSTAAVHNQVRQDLRVDDCRALAETLRQDLIGPLVRFNFGDDAPVPHLCFQCQPPTDRELESRILVNLHQAGFAVDPAAVAARFGYPLQAAASSQTPSAPAG